MFLNGIYSPVIAWCPLKGHIYSNKPAAAAAA